MDSLATMGKAAIKNLDHRHLARQLALQALYQLAMQQGENLAQLDGFFDEHGAADAEPLARQWSLGTWRDLAQIDKQIEMVSSNWDLTRMNLIDHSNLRLAVYQFLHCPGIPPKVVINEAIELAKTFSSASAPAFVNGLLDAICKKLAQKPEAAPQTIHETP